MTLTMIPSILRCKTYLTLTFQIVEKFVILFESSLLPSVYIKPWWWECTVYHSIMLQRKACRYCIKDGSRMNISDNTHYHKRTSVTFERIITNKLFQCEMEFMAIWLIICEYIECKVKDVRTLMIILIIIRPNAWRKRNYNGLVVSIRDGVYGI